MAQSTEEVLLNLLRDIFSVPCIHITSSLLNPMATGPIFSASASSGNEVQTMTLLLREAHSASLSQLVEFLLQLLLSHPPFKHTSPRLLIDHQSCFLAIWKGDIEVSSAAELSPTATDTRRSLTPLQGLNLLVELRVSFQKLAEVGFGFVSELLLSCVYRLCSASGGSGQNWVNVHKKTVDILSELLCSVPTVIWLKQEENAKYITAVWKCLQLLTSGATWWGKNEDFERSLERLARRFLKLKVILSTTSSLLWGALRVDLKPADIHSTLSLLLAPLERLHGISVSEEINAFTPTPFNFPILSALDRHDFTKPYEFANLRVLFVAWVNADAGHRKIEEFRGPWGMDKILQHIDAYKRLKLHPESAVRVALGYIFNEVQLGKENFKPSTDLKAIELLKIFLSHRNTEALRADVSSPTSFLAATGKPGSKPEACIIMNAEWVLPWMWRRRNTDLEFVMLMTSVWMFALWEEREVLMHEHPMFKVMVKHHAVLEVFNDFFKHLFSHDFIASTGTPKETLSQICQLLTMTLQAVRLFSAPNLSMVNQQLYVRIIQCFVDSVDQEWISTSCWALVCEIFARIPRNLLTEAFLSAKVGSKMDLFIPVLLREIETVTSHCENHSVVSLPIETLAARLENLTVMLQFVILAARADNEICSSFAKKSHFIASMLKYVDQDYGSLLIRSSRPELIWTHAASIGAGCEILIVTWFGVGIASVIGESGNASVPLVRGMIREVKDQAAMKVAVKLIGHSFEMSYIISPLCGLVAVLGADAWARNQFTYLDIFSYIRMVLLQHGAHKWCCLFPVFIQAITALLNVDAPIRIDQTIITGHLENGVEAYVNTGQILLENRWNLELVVIMVARIKNDEMCCNDCGVDFSESILNLVALLVERRPAWYRDLMEGGGMGRYSMLTVEILEGAFEKILGKATGENDQMRLAGPVIRILKAFPEWVNKGMVMERRLERAIGNLGKECEVGGKGFYRIYGPIEGVPFCLVPS